MRLTHIPVLKHTVLWRTRVLELMSRSHERLTEALIIQSRILAVLAYGASSARVNPRITLLPRRAIANDPADEKPVKKAKCDLDSPPTCRHCHNQASHTCANGSCGPCCRNQPSAACARHGVLRKDAENYLTQIDQSFQHLLAETWRAAADGLPAPLTPAEMAPWRSAPRTPSYMSMPHHFACTPPRTPPPTPR